MLLDDLYQLSFHLTGFFFEPTLDRVNECDIYEHSESKYQLEFKKKLFRFENACDEHDKE